MSVTTWDVTQPTVTVGSAIDPTKPTETVAYTQDVRDNFAAAKAEIEALQTTLAGFSVDVNGDVVFDVPFIVHNSGTTKAQFGQRAGTGYANYSLWFPSNVEIDIGAAGDENCSAWLFTDNNDGTVGNGNTGQAGVGSGNSTGGTSGGVWIWSGDAGVTTGGVGMSSGSGLAPGAISGNLDLTTGAADNTGAISIETGQSTSGSSGYIGIGTGNSGGGNSGPLDIWTGSTSGTGTAADIQILPGQGADAAHSGWLYIETAKAMIIQLLTGAYFKVNLPTTNPAIAGALWVDPAAGFVVKQSQG